MARPEVRGAARHDHAQGLDLVVRGVGAVAPARERVEADLALDLPCEPRCEGRRVRPSAFTLTCSAP